MKSFKKMWALIAALVCVFVFVCSASAAEPKAYGGADLDYIDIIPITRDSSGRYTYRKDLLESFEVDYLTGNIVGTSQNMDNLPNLFAIQYCVGWTSPSYRYVHVTDPTNGIHRSKYGLEDLQVVKLEDCNGNLHLDISCDGIIDTVDIAIPTHSSSGSDAPRPVN